MSLLKTALMQIVEHPFHVLLEIMFAVAFAYVMLQRKRARDSVVAAAAKKAALMPSPEEQERRLAAFKSVPFHEESSMTSTVPVADYKGTHEIVGRNGCHVTVTGGMFTQPTECLDLATYDYHSFSTNPEVLECAKKTVMAYGVGSCGPRGFYGTVKPHLEAETDIKKFMKTDDAVVYSFAYATVATLISCFGSRGDYLVADEYVSAPVEEGCRLSRANLTHYRHNDMADLEAKLKAIADADNPKKPKRRFVVTEGVFYSLGDICRLPETVALCRKYKFRLILEDSYGIGAVGKTGRGTPEHFNMPTSEVDVYVGSLSTAFGMVGGFCAGGVQMVDYQRLSAAAYVFSASLPPYVTASVSAVLNILDHDTSYVSNLQKNAKTMRGTLRDAKLNTSKIGLVECAGDASPLIVLQPTESYVSEKGAEAVTNQIQRVVNACETAKVLVLRHVYTTDEPAKNAPGLRVVVKSSLTADDLAEAGRTIVDAIKAEFSA